MRIFVHKFYIIALSKYWQGVLFLGSLIILTGTLCCCPVSCVYLLASQMSFCCMKECLPNVFSITCRVWASSKITFSLYLYTFSFSSLFPSFLPSSSSLLLLVSDNVVLRCHRWRVRLWNVCQFEGLSWPYRGTSRRLNLLNINNLFPYFSLILSSSFRYTLFQKISSLIYMISSAS